MSLTRAERSAVEQTPEALLAVGADPGPTQSPSTPAPPRRGARRAAAVRSTLRQPGLVLALLLLAAVLVAAWAPTLFTGLSPIEATGERLAPPSAAHWFGTDEQGRDVFARVVHGTSASAKAVVIAVLVGLVAGSGLGLLAAWVGGIVDDVVMRIVDVLLSVPALLIALAFITALGFGTVNIAIAVGIGNVASFARLMRAEVLRIKQFAFVEATTFAGIGRARVLRRHVVPNAVGPVLVLATLEVGMALLAVSALSFLGFGAPPPAPEWGSLVSGGRDFLGVAWWMTTLPGLVLAATVVAANRVARAIDGDRGIAL